jgi:quinol monooxygenase YgiN
MRFYVEPIKAEAIDAVSSLLYKTRTYLGNLLHTYTIKIVPSERINLNRPCIMSSIKTTQMTLHVTIRIDPANIEPFLKALRPCWTACLQEPECIFFDVYHDPSEPGTFRFVETWTKDEDWFRKNQLTKSYYDPYQAITKPIWIADREMAFFERVNGWSYVDDVYLASSVRP